MRMLLLGATGRTGHWVLREALATGHEVVCLVRDTTKLPTQKGMLVIQGDPLDTVVLQKSIAKCDAVISVLNVSRKSDFPWAPLRTPDYFLSEVMGKLIPLAKDEGVRRLIVCSAWGVAETREDIPGWFRWMIDNSNIGAAYADHERQEALIESSHLDWTIVRPVGLTNSQKAEIVRETYDNEPKPKLTISRQSVAKYLVNCLAEGASIRKKVTISKG